MKIRCQEHYDKVVEYAKSIGDTTFQNCIERLKQWEKNSNGRYEIELYRDFAPHSFGFAKGEELQRRCLFLWEKRLLSLFLPGT